MTQLIFQITTEHLPKKKGRPTQVQLHRLCYLTVLCRCRCTHGDMHKACGLVSVNCRSSIYSMHAGPCNHKDCAAQRHMKVLKGGKQLIRPGGCLNLWWCTIVTLGAARLSTAGLDAWCLQPSGFGRDSCGRHRLVPTSSKHFQRVYEWEWHVHLYCVSSVWEPQQSSCGDVALSQIPLYMLCICLHCAGRCSRALQPQATRIPR